MILRHSVVAMASFAGVIAIADCGSSTPNSGGSSSGSHSSNSGSTGGGGSSGTSGGGGSSGTSGGGGSSGTSGGGGSSGTSGGGGSSGTASSSGSAAGNDGGCTINGQFTAQNCAACTRCLEPYCCTQINNCYADTGCAQILACQSNCYSGMSADGGTFDAGDVAAGDACALACMMSASASSNSLWTAQDDCQNNGAAMTMCNAGKPTDPCMCP